MPCEYESGLMSRLLPSPPPGTVSRLPPYYRGFPFPSLFSTFENHTLPFLPRFTAPVLPPVLHTLHHPHNYVARALTKETYTTTSVPPLATLCETKTKHSCPRFTPESMPSRLFFDSSFSSLFLHLDFFSILPSVFVPCVCLSASYFFVYFVAFESFPRLRGCLPSRFFLCCLFSLHSRWFCFSLLLPRSLLLYHFTVHHSHPRPSRGFSLYLFLLV